MKMLCHILLSKLLQQPIFLFSVQELFLIKSLFCLFFQYVLRYLFYPRYLYPSATKDEKPEEKMFILPRLNYSLITIIIKLSDATPLDYI